MKDLKLEYTHFLFISAFILVLGITIGIIVSHKCYYSIDSQTGYNIAMNFKSSSVPLSFKEILYVNLKVILLLSFGGVITFGGLTLLNLIFNGINIGVMSYDLLTSSNLKIFLFLVLPPGIFEIPALIIAGTAGFKIPYEVLRFALGRKEEMVSERDAKEFFKLVAISVVLIFIAAIIESTITLKIAESLG